MLKDAAPIGPSSMIDSADAMRSGLPIVVSHGCVNVGMRRCETVKPTNPAEIDALMKSDAYTKHIGQ